MFIKAENKDVQILSRLLERDFLNAEQCACVNLRFFFAGKRGSRRHSTTGFREIEIVVEADTSYQMFVVLSFWDGDKALLQSIN